MRLIAACSLLLIAALWAVGIEASQPIRHFVQTSPIWIAVVLALRRHALAKWFALPVFLFWLFAMALIWLFLLGWARVITGNFTGVEIALTFAIGAASLVGAVACIRLRTRSGWLAAGAIFVVSAVLQLAAVQISMSPGIARR